MLINHPTEYINKTGLQPVSRPMEQVPLLRGLDAKAGGEWVQSLILS